MDLTVAGSRSSPEHGLAAAPGHDDLPLRHERQAGDVGTLVAGSPRMKLNNGDQCGATRGADWREGEERRARCGEAEAEARRIL
jgi:hypothetical protein